LQHERSSRSLGPRSSGEEVSPFPQPFHSAHVPEQRIPVLPGWTYASWLPEPPGAALRHSVACVRVPGGQQSHAAHPWSPCGCGNRDGACAPAYLVDRSASRKPRLRGYHSDIKPSADADTKSANPTGELGEIAQVARLIKE
jgi:hypothetical protein